MTCQGRVIELDVEPELALESVAGQEPVHRSRVIVVLVLGGLHGLGLDEQLTLEADAVLVVHHEVEEPCPLGILTRGISGVRGRTLIVNFPGSPKAIGQSWPIVEPTLRHAAETLER